MGRGEARQLDPQPALLCSALLFSSPNHVRNILSAMDRARSKIVIMSLVLADVSDTSIRQREKGISCMRNLFMMQAMGGQEREMQQWQALVRDADQDLEIVSVSQEAEGERVKRG